MTDIFAIKAFNDNYIWAIPTDDKMVAVVDPGDGEVVAEYCKANNLKLSAIIITHRHSDHIGGVDMLRTDEITVYSPPGSLAMADVWVEDGDYINIGNVELQVIATPGHTGEHVSYHGAKIEVLFCGDTLFSAGCGRIFDGTHAQLMHSISKLASLPKNTRVFAAHEYSLSNLTFAAAVDPENEAIMQVTKCYQDLRQTDTPTLPSTIAREWLINPFLRCQDQKLRQQMLEPLPGLTAEEAFAFLREAKDSFRA